MAASKKRKIDSESRKFQTQWETDNFFTETNGRCVCVICNETVAVMKEYNVGRHFETKHEFRIVHGCRANTEGEAIDSWPASPTKSVFSWEQNATAASYDVAMLIAQHGKPFSDGDFVKQCLMKVTERMYPEKVQDYNNVSLSRNTIVRRIEDLSANVLLQLKEKA